MSTLLVDAEAISLRQRLAPTNLSIPAGSLTAVIGPNGSGKTSLLRALARIERPGGRVWLDGKDLDRQPPAWRAARLGFLPAGREISWAIPVRDLLALGGSSPAALRHSEVVERLELGPLLDRPVDRLSTGERSRVLLGRLLLAGPVLLLLDEPLSHLDPYWVLWVLKMLREAAQAGASVLVTLHDLHQIGRFDRVLVMENGRIADDGSPRDVLTSPVFERVFRVPADAVADLCG